MMYINTLAFGIMIYMIPLVGGAAVTKGSNKPKWMVRNENKEILSDANLGANSDILKALSGIEELKNRINVLEQKVLSLEQQNEEKDKIISSLQEHALWECDLRCETVESSTENESSELVNEILEGDHTGTKMRNEKLMRKKRQITVPKLPTVQNIAFSTYLTHTHSNMSPRQTIIFDHIMLNDGHGYNSYNGIFTAPLSGTYLFTFHFDARVHTFVRLNADGVNIIDAVANPHTTNTQDRETMSGNTVVIHVGIGQAVSVEVYDVSGEAASSDKYRLCTFSGFLLYPEQ